jgi:hypothetical protein
MMVSAKSLFRSDQAARGTQETGTIDLGETLSAAAGLEVEMTAATLNLCFSSCSHEAVLC